MEHVMIDLETLGRRAGCSILSIGAVAFDPVTKQLGPEFYVVVNRFSCSIMNLHEDPETIRWWEGQSAEARKILMEVDGTCGESLIDALKKLSEYLSQFGLGKVKIWGNGSDFDNSILAHCYAQIGKDTPWLFWNNRCYRTLKSLKPDIKMVRQGTYHNALDDAKSQAVHAIELLG